MARLLDPKYGASHHGDLARAAFDLGSLSGDVSSLEWEPGECAENRSISPGPVFPNPLVRWLKRKERRS